MARTRTAGIQADADGSKVVDKWVLGCGSSGASASSIRTRPKPGLRGKLRGCGKPTFASRYDYTLQALRDVPYNAWRTYDPDNTLRFYSVRLHELGMIKSTPQKLIAEGTDWRFLNELKRELKA